MPKSNLIEVDASTATTAHEQVVLRLRKLIVEGELRSGEQLPPMRELAKQAKTNPMTVCLAVRILKNEGLLATAGRRGTFVKAGAASLAADQTRRQAIIQLDEVFCRLASWGISQKELHELSQASISEIKKGRRQ